MLRTLLVHGLFRIVWYLRGIIFEQWRPRWREPRYAHRHSGVNIQRLRLSGWTAALTKRLHQDGPRQNAVGHDNYITNTNCVVSLLDG
jgi:hypothetical protein